jgi:hypothetical protein
MVTRFGACAQKVLLDEMKLKINEAVGSSKQCFCRKCCASDGALMSAAAISTWSWAGPESYPAVLSEYGVLTQRNAL